MTDTSVPTVDVGERTVIALSLMAILAGLTAAYYTARSGNPHPLFWVCAGLTLFVLFFASEE